MPRRVLIAIVRYPTKQDSLIEVYRRENEVVSEENTVHSLFLTVNV